MLIQAGMSDDRALKAVGRIEQALARIEAAAKAPQPPTGNEELRRLREVHQALRGKVEGAISDIDRMLAARERV
jgi:hypothetical protein